MVFILDNIVSMPMFTNKAAITKTLQYQAVLNKGLTRLISLSHFQSDHQFFFRLIIAIYSILYILNPECQHHPSLPRTEHHLGGVQDN